MSAMMMLNAFCASTRRTERRPPSRNNNARRALCRCFRLSKNSAPRAAKAFCAMMMTHQSGDVDYQKGKEDDTRYPIYRVLRDALIKETTLL